MPLHPSFREYLDDIAPLIEEANRQGIEPTPASARAALAGLNQFTQPPIDVELIVERHVHGEYPIPVRIYVPRPGEARDVILFVHGGGHMAGDLDVYDFSARRTAATTGMVVVSVDYRRSPETLYPGGLEDVYAVLHGLDGLLGDIATTGAVHAMADSGGAAKVASIAMRVAAGEWSSPIERQLLLYPSLDYTMSGSSLEEFGTGYFLSAERVAWYFDHYFPADADRQKASPLFGPFTSDMPDTLVIAAEYDPLLSEATAYVENMKSVGARSHLLIVPGMIHAFAFFEKKIPEIIDRLDVVVQDFFKDGVVPEVW